jgi:hypothetical protein
VERASNGGGCSDIPLKIRLAPDIDNSTARYGYLATGGANGCHDISDLAYLHKDLAGWGCESCHGAGKSPATECLTCHPEGGQIETKPYGSSIYHHLNAKYLVNPFDVRVPGDMVYLDSDANYCRSWGHDAMNRMWDIGYGFAPPPNHWNTALYDFECGTKCHYDGRAQVFTAQGGDGSVFGLPYGSPATTAHWWSKGNTLATSSFYSTTLTYNNQINWTIGATPTVTFKTHYQIAGNGTGNLQISNDNGTTWTNVTSGTFEGIPKPAVTGLSTTMSADGWVTANYNLASYVETMNGAPIYDENPATWTWAWDSWVPSFLQIPANVGQSFWYDDAFYNTLSPADQLTYNDLLWNQWYEGCPFGYYAKPILGYQIVGRPFKIRFRQVFGWANYDDWRIADFEAIGNVSKATLADPYSWTSLAIPGTYGNDPKWTLYDGADAVNSEMWYSGRGDFARGTVTRTLTLKNAIDLPSYWQNQHPNDVPQLSLQINHWLQGSDAAYVEAAVDGGEWQTLSGTVDGVAGVSTLTSTSVSAANPGGWVAATYDLSNLQGESDSLLKVRVRYVNGSTSMAWGVGVSSVEIKYGGSELLSDAQTRNPANWDSVGWRRQAEPGQMWYSLFAAASPWPTERTLELTATLPTDAPKLSFATQYDFGSPRYYNNERGQWYEAVNGGNGFVEVSSNGGSTWEVVPGTVGGTAMTFIPTQTKSIGWVPATYDLSAYAGDTVKIRFRWSDLEQTCWAGGGWGIDNISIGGTSGPVFTDDAETLNPQWTSNFWIRSWAAGANGGTTSY